MNSKDILSIILKIAENIKYKDSMFNERYLHHMFTSLLQKKQDLLNLTSLTLKDTILHPEWPTYKKQSKIECGKYKKENNKYIPHKSGTAGFIDFALGDYIDPKIGIEFTLKYSWSKEEITYDFVKLLDKNNPFQISISYNIIFRKNQLVKNNKLLNLENAMNNAYSEAIKRLKNNICDKNRNIFFIISEIDKTNERHHWHYSKQNRKFVNGLPIINLKNKLYLEGF
jgi:hypothetical protein